MLYRSCVGATWATCDRGIGPSGLAIMSSASSRGLMSHAIGQEHHHIDGASALERLANDLPRIRGFYRIEHVLHFETGCRERLRQEFDGDGRRAALALELQIDDARHFSQRGDDLVPGRIERVEVIAEYLDRDLRRLAAQALADAIAQKGDHFALDPGIVLQDLPQLLAAPRSDRPSSPPSARREIRSMRTPVSSPSSARPTCCSMLCT